MGWPESPASFASPTGSPSARFVARGSIRTVMRRHDSFFARYAWGVLVYNILVILWGAVVRASGSGNGCGEHWPLCGGEVIPHAAQIATLIEFAHRMTSGIDLILVVLLVVFSLRRLPRGHNSRHFAGAALAFTLIEGLLGAALVLFGAVGTNASMSRVVLLSIHLVNTFLLLASLALTAWAAGRRPEDHGGNDEPMPPAGGGWTAAYGLALLAVVAVAVTGTIAALADTLYKAATLGAGLQMDFSTTSSPILRLRIIHPVLAVTVAAYLLALAARTRAASTGGGTDATRAATGVRRLAGWLIGLVCVQVAAGLLDVMLLTPIWVQVLHLLTADLIWIVLVLLSAELVARRAGTAASLPAREPAPDAGPSVSSS